jgi:hypothetical protein
VSTGHKGSLLHPASQLDGGGEPGFSLWPLCLQKQPCSSLNNLSWPKGQEVSGVKPVVSTFYGLSPRHPTLLSLARPPHLHGTGPTISPLHIPLVILQNKQPNPCPRPTWGTPPLFLPIWLGPGFLIRCLLWSPFPL